MSNRFANAMDEDNGTSTVPGAAQVFKAPTPNLPPRRGGKISVTEGGDVALPGGVTITSLGLVIDGEIDRDAWLAIGQMTQKIQSALGFIWGDWILYGGARQYGSTYQEAVELSGIEQKTLEQYVWVCNAIEISRRRELSFSHHVEVAGLTAEEQDYWLQQAIEHRWSTRVLRAAIQGDSPTPPDQVAKFSQFLAQTRKKWERYRKLFERGGGSKVQITQMLDEEIAYLQALRDKLRK